MSSPRKHDDRRIGFSIDRFGRKRSDRRDGEWSEGVRAEGQWAYLLVLARERPAVLTSLLDVMHGDDGGLRAWAAHWGLESSDPEDDWTLAHARATVKHCTHYGVILWFDRDDKAGCLVPENLDAVPVESRPLRHGEHFVWLAKFQLGERWNQVSPGTPAQTVQEAARTLAHHIRLQLRPTRRGRPAK